MIGSDPDFAVRFLFRFCLHREADPGGFATYVNGYANGSMTLNTIMTAMQDSEEGQLVLSGALRPGV